MHLRPKIYHAQRTLTLLELKVIVIKEAVFRYQMPYDKLMSVVGLDRVICLRLDKHI